MSRSSTNTIIAVAVTAVVGAFLAYRLLFSNKNPIKEDKVNGDDAEAETVGDDAEAETSEDDVEAEAEKLEESKDGREVDNDEGAILTTSARSASQPTSANKPNYKAANIADRSSEDLYVLEEDVSEDETPNKESNSGVLICDELRVALKRGDKEWLDDKKVTNCMICDAKFTALVCRCCSACVCNETFDYAN